MICYLWESFVSEIIVFEFRLWNVYTFKSLHRQVDQFEFLLPYQALKAYSDNSQPVHVDVFKTTITHRIVAVLVALRSAMQGQTPKGTIFNACLKLSPFYCAAIFRLETSSTNTTTSKFDPQLCKEWLCFVFFYLFLNFSLHLLSLHRLAVVVRFHSGLRNTSAVMLYQGESNFKNVRTFNNPYHFYYLYDQKKRSRFILKWGNQGHNGHIEQMLILRP